MEESGQNPNQYRVELAMSGRAGCQDGQCKAEGKKIPKGELRFGTWVTLQGTEHGSFRWKHWGCVSGSQIQSAKDEIMKDGVMDFGYLDGYDELEDAGLQEKVRRCFEQGHIDPEDFNGDPEYNVPGKRGIRGRKRKAVDEESDGGSAKSPTKKPKQDPEGQNDEDDMPSRKGAKRHKATGAVKGEDGESAKPTKKARASKVVKEESEEPVKSTKKARASNAIKQESEDLAKPTKKAKASKPIKDEPDELGESAKPTKKTKASKPIKDEADELDEQTKPTKKPRQSKNIKKEVSEAEVDEPKVMANTKAKRRPKVDEEKTSIRASEGPKSSEKTLIKNEDTSEDELRAPQDKAAIRKKPAKANKEVEATADVAKPTKGGRVKKAAALKTSDGAEEAPAPATKRAKGRKKATAEDDETAEPADVHPARAKGRKKSSKP